MRGIAACIVVIYHMGDFRAFPQIFPHGYLAVDFFFMLSGFVLSYAYQAPLDKGWPSTNFLLTRAVRLYPLYLLGLLFGICFNLLELKLGIHPWFYLHSFPAIVLLGLLGLPCPHTFRPFIIQFTPGGLFPLNVASWSLFVEMLANVVHATALRRRSTAFLVWALGIAVILFVRGAFRYHTINFGARNGEFLSGVVRSLSSYIAGMLLFRYWKHGRWPFAIPPLVLAILFAALATVPATGKNLGLFDLAVVAVVFPCILLSGASAVAPPRLVWIFSQLGLVSYAIYALHVPLLEIVTVTLSHAHVGLFHRSRLALGFVPPVLVAVFANYFYDIPVRRWLRSRLTWQSGRTTAH